MSSHILSPESRRQLHEADRRWQLYAALRAVALTFSLIGLSVFASAIPIWNKYFYWGNGPNRGDWQDGFPLGVLVFTFLWNIVALYLLLFRKKPLQPWIPLVVDFLAWGALVPAITWSTGLGMFLNWTDRIEDYVDPKLWDILVNIGRRELAGVCFACFVWLLEVILFIFACIDTHKWRKARKGGKPSMRTLDHGELAPDQHPPPPIRFGTITTIGYAGTTPKDDDESAHGHDRDIEMSPTSPRSREFV